MGAIGASADVAGIAAMDAMGVAAEDVPYIRIDAAL